MMTFTRIPARDVRPGALLLIDHGRNKIVYAIRDVSEHAGTIKVIFTDDVPEHYGPDDMVWVAQR